MARQGLSLCSASSQQKGWVLKPEHQSQTAEPRTRFGWVLKQEHLEMALSAIVPSAAPRVEGGDVGGVEMLVNGGNGCQKASSGSRGKPRAWQDLI